MGSLSCYSPCMLRYPSICRFLIQLFGFSQFPIQFLLLQFRRIGLEELWVICLVRRLFIFLLFLVRFSCLFWCPFAHLFLSGPYLIQMVLLVSGTLIQVNLSLLYAYKLHDRLTSDTGKMVPESIHGFSLCSYHFPLYLI